jgi:hypothetical protein
MNRAGFSMNKLHNRMNLCLFLDRFGIHWQHIRTVTFSVRTILRRLGLPVVCVAMFSLLGGHWAVFQVIAWTQMLRDYSRDAGLVEAVEKTFSGKAPCAMCCAITKEKQKEEKKPATFKVDKKAEIFFAAGEGGLPDRGFSPFSYRFPEDMIVVARPSRPTAPVPIGIA